MPTRHATAVWEGGLKSGKGTFKGESGAIQASYSFGTRFGNAKGSNPEELLAAAEAACYSMALSARPREGGQSSNQDSDRRRVHCGSGRRGIQDHNNEIVRSRHRAGDRPGRVSEDRRGDEGRLSRVAGAQRSGNRVGRATGLARRSRVTDWA